MKDLNRILQCLLAILIIRHSIAASSGYFTAAVYEHARLDDEFPDTQVETNLRWYERATTLAKKQGADMILFPEYGLFFPSSELRVIKRHLECIPNPTESKANPCDESALYSERPILHSLSCMAKKNSIVVVANMGGKEVCKSQPDCPEDGDLHLNANVAFNTDGTLLRRYYKERLYFESGMDLPREKQDPIFETGFGKFAMFISFDIVFKKMAIVSRMADVDAILFSSMWMNSFPFFMSTPWFQAWAMGTNATLLAANVQIPRYLAAGSGIFRGTAGAIASTYNVDGISKLIVATIPKEHRRNGSNLPATRITAIYENSTKLWQDQDDGKDLLSTYSIPILGKVEYILKKLNKNSDRIEVCDKGMCCKLEYSANKMNESFYLGVHSGIHNAYDKYFWSEDNCFLARCDDVNGTACSNYPTKSETIFNKIFLTANFKSKIVYPWLVSSRMRLVPAENWSYEIKYNKPSIQFSKSAGIKLLVAGLKGRSYDNDPPYIR